jgi:hypothetical protein
LTAGGEHALSQTRTKEAQKYGPQSRVQIAAERYNDSGDDGVFYLLICQTREIAQNEIKRTSGARSSGGSTPIFPAVSADTHFSTQERLGHEQRCRKEQ